MSIVFPSCPHLPSPPEAMDWRNFALHGDARGGAFYLTALEYGNFLWQRGRAARALLCLDRAMGADLSGDDSILASWPIPYAAMVWILAKTPEDVFIGNPRVHFQHYAGRMNEPRRDQRRWRAWACWAIACAVRPNLPGDPKHIVTEPTHEEIAARLQDFGAPDEITLWKENLLYASSFARK